MPTHMSTHMSMPMSIYMSALMSIHMSIHRYNALQSLPPSLVQLKKLTLIDISMNPNLPFPSRYHEPAEAKQFLEYFRSHTVLAGIVMADITVA